MFRKALVFLLLAVFVLPLFAFYPSDSALSGDGEVIFVGSGIYDAFDDLFLLLGMPRPSSSRPWTVAEAKYELSRIDGESLTGYERQLFDYISERIFGDETGIAVDLSFSPEIYLHTNDNTVLEEQWNYGYTRRNPILYLGVNAWNGGFAFHTELTAGNGRAGSKDTFETLGEMVASQGRVFEGVGDVKNEYGISGDNLENIKVVKESAIYSPFFAFNGLGTTDNEIPRIATLTFAGDSFSFGIYRAQKVWGNNRIGNFIFDDHVGRYTYITYKNFNSKFSFESTIMFPEAYLGGNNETVDYGTKRRLFLAHRFDIPMGESMKLTVSENVMYLASYFFDFQYLNPATIYHNNINSSQFNAIAHVEYEYAPLPGLAIYAQLAIDQGTVPFFEKTKEDQAIGISLGSEYAFALSKGICDVNLEVLYATPALYRRDAPDFVITDSSQISGGYLSIPSFTYIGLKYGGDTFAVRLDGEYKAIDTKFYGSETLLLKGGFDLYQKYSPASFVGEFLSGEPKLSSITEFGAEKSFVLLKADCSAFANISLIYDNSEFDCQVAIGLKASLSSRKK